MSQERLDATSFSLDTLDFLKALYKYDVNYMIVGGEAVIYYGYARVTGDIDFFYERSDANVQRLYDALSDFWNGTVPGLTGAEELLEAGLILQFGVPPNRIDLVNKVDGVTFVQAWPDRVPVAIDCVDTQISVYFVGMQDLIQNKRAAARPKDFDDLRFLERQSG